MPDEYLELRKRLTEKAQLLKYDGDWQTADLLREARNVIERLEERYDLDLDPIIITDDPSPDSFAEGILDREIESEEEKFPSS